MKNITIIFVFYSFYAQAAFKIEYSNSFSLEVTDSKLSYLSKYYSQSIPIKKCNKKISDNIQKLFNEHKTLIRIPNKFVKNIEYKKNNKITDTNFGSKVHKSLENFPKKAHTLITMMRQKCN